VASQGTVQPSGHSASDTPNSHTVQNGRGDSSQIDADLIRDTPRIDPRLAAALIDAQNVRAMAIFIPDPSKVLNLGDIINHHDKAAEPSVSFLDWLGLVEGLSTYKIQHGISPNAPGFGDDIVLNKRPNMLKPRCSCRRARSHVQDISVEANKTGDDDLAELTVTELDELRRKHELLNIQSLNSMQTPKRSDAARHWAVKKANCTLSLLRLQSPPEPPIVYIPKWNIESVSEFFKDKEPIGFVLGCHKYTFSTTTMAMRNPETLSAPIQFRLCDPLFEDSTLPLTTPLRSSQPLQQANKTGSGDEDHMMDVTPLQKIAKCARQSLLKTTAHPLLKKRNQIDMWNTS
jgi:hypothetical protein